MSARWFEQASDFSDGFGTWPDVSHCGARVAVPGLGHDQLQGDALFTEVGGGLLFPDIERQLAHGSRGEWLVDGEIGPRPQ